MDEEITKAETSEQNSGVFSQLKSSLKKTRESLAGRIDNVVQGTANVSSELLDELEEALLMADVGSNATQFILNQLQEDVAKNRLRTNKEIRSKLQVLLASILKENVIEWEIPKKGPLVILMIGVNGSGKTTTIGKLAQKWKTEGRNIVIAAGDTFRAAAADQLQVWADRIGVTCIRQKMGSDPSAVAFDAVQAGVARKADIVLIDTAGRLQTNVNLMGELKKIKRVIGKVIPDAPHRTLLVLDACIGQNSLSQAKMFHEAMKIDGLAMTKLDGTSKGGVLFHISRELKVPICFIGVGEGPEDLQEFDAENFVQALLDN